MLSAALTGIFIPAGALAASRRLKVGFVNPGRRTDQYWQMADMVMQAAAKRFKIDLIDAWGERDRQRIISSGRAIIAQRPDYVIIVNEHRTAPPLLTAAIETGVPSLVAFSGLTSDDVNSLGAPRDRDAHYLGSLTADNLGAGHSMAHALLAACRQQRAITKQTGDVSVLALGGMPATPAGYERSEGMRRALAADGRAQLLDHVTVNWSRDEARDRALALLRRQPQAEGFWCASDDMALGAMEAAESLGRTPGKDIAFVGMNWQEDALHEVAAGRLALSMGGHFLLGAWALAMLRDHADGRDFAKAGGTSQQLTLAALERDQVTAYLAQYAGQGWARIDYDRFRQRAGVYDLNVDSVLTG